MQLVAYGAQDVYLTGNPQITFFKVVYRRHTNFAMESIQQTFNGNATALGSRVSCTVSRNGDLIHKMYLRVKIPSVLLAGTTVFNWANKLGLALIKNVELEIGGQRIDKHYGDWMNIWNELSLPESKRAGYNELVGAQGSSSQVIDANVGKTLTQGTDTTAAKLGSGASDTLAGVTLNIPLEFWFCRNPGLALPLIALQYHEVKVNVEYNTAEWLNYKTAAGTVTVSGGTATTAAGAASFSLGESALWVDYIYLDTDERRRFAQTSHEYLIEQLQFTGEESVTKGTENASIRLNFNHPVKELVWVAQPSANVATETKAGNQFQYDIYSDGATEQTHGTGLRVNPVASATLKLNGHDRMAQRDGTYYNSVQPFQHHTRVPSDKGINVYSFALKPEEHQPSGTCNMSRIDVAQLQMNFVAHSTSSLGVRVYATNYNVLRIMSGMGGLAYAN